MGFASTLSAGVARQRVCVLVLLSGPVSDAKIVFLESLEPLCKLTFGFLEMG